MDWNNTLLIVFVVVMLVCCGSMMRMAFGQKRERRDKDQEEHPQ